MKKVSENTLLEAAHNLMFDINSVELEVLKEEYADILEAIEFMKTIPHIDEVKPMVFPYEVVTEFLRDDVAETPLRQEDVLANAYKADEGHIVIPKVVK